jgi:hypothetical protein
MIPRVDSDKQRGDKAVSGRHVWDMRRDGRWLEAIVDI